MAIASEVKALIVAIPHIGVTASQVFLDHMPATPHVCGAVITTPGSPPVGGFGVVGVKFEYPSVTVRFRGEPYDKAGPAARARLAHSKMLLKGVSLSGVRYLSLQPTGSPYQFEIDPQHRVVWAFNVASEKEPS